MKKLFIISLALLLPGIGKLCAQQFTDSLAGFDENAAIRTSIEQNFLGSELRVHFNQLKRKYINEKYGIKSEPLFNNQFANKTSTFSAACVNEDFEAGTNTTTAITNSTQVLGWTIASGTNQNSSNSCNLLGCCPANPVEAMLIYAPNGYIDATIGSVYPLYSVFGSAPSNTNAAVANPQISSTMYGNSFIRINSSSSNFSIERLSKTFSVTSANSLLRFAFASVQSGSHPCCDAGGFILRMTNVTTNSVLSAVSYSASGLSTQCSYTNGVTFYNTGSGTPATPSSFVVFNKWHTNYIDLTPYIGQNVSIEVISTDCTAGAHAGYCYFDSQCSPMEIQVNGQNKNLSCTATATITAPENMPSYLWMGPSGFTASSQSFTTNTAGLYTLVLPQNPPFSALQKTLSLIVSPASVSVTASSTNICKGEKVIISASGLSNYLWSNNAGTAPTITVQPSATITYTLTGANTASCQGFALMTVNVNKCTGINNIEISNRVILFPNPNKGEFFLRVNKFVSEAEIDIINNLGQVVYKQAVQQGENTVKAKGLSNGIYYYIVNDGPLEIASGKISIE